MHYIAIVKAPILRKNGSKKKIVWEIGNLVRFRANTLDEAIIWLKENLPIKDKKIVGHLKKERGDSKCYRTGAIFENPQNGIPRRWGCKIEVLVGGKFHDLKPEITDIVL